MVLALYLTIVILVAALLGLTWFAAMWGVSPIALFPLYLVGLLIVVGLVLGVRHFRKLSHAQEAERP
jgi:hypothetical protein